MHEVFWTEIWWYFKFFVCLKPVSKYHIFFPYKIVIWAYKDGGFISIFSSTAISSIIFPGILKRANKFFPVGFDKVTHTLRIWRRRFVVLRIIARVYAKNAWLILRF